MVLFDWAAPGKSVNIFLNFSGVDLTTATNGETTFLSPIAIATGWWGPVDFISTSCLARRSTNRWWCWRKSAPKIGNCTYASKKVYLKRLLFKEKTKIFSPQHFIFLPPGPDNLGPHGLAFEKCGSIKTAAPVSTKKFVPEVWHLRRRSLPGVTALMHPRMVSFPATCR